MMYSAGVAGAAVAAGSGGAGIVATAAGSGAGVAMGNAGGDGVGLGIVVGNRSGCVANGVATLWRGELQLIWIDRHSNNRVVAVIAFVIGVILYWPAARDDGSVVAVAVGVGEGVDVGVSVELAVEGGFGCCLDIVSPPNSFD